MKTKTTLKILLIICFITCLGTSFNVFGQLNHFLPDSNAYISVSPYKFWFMDDTIISSKQYKKVYVQSYDSIPDFAQAVYFAAVREDTLNEKIYSFQKIDTTERLIADFAVQAGDTVSVFAYWWILNLSQPTPLPKTSTIHSVDSVLIHNNYHKRINFHQGPYNGGSYNESWIEGIGSTWGLFFPNVHINISTIEPPKLLCVHIEDTLFYQYPYFWYSCYLHDYFVWIEKEENNPMQLHVYPTLVDDLLYIHFTGNTPISLTAYSVFDLSGRLVKHDTLITNSINVSELISGFYIISIYNAEKTFLFNRKFIIK